MTGAAISKPLIGIVGGTGLLGAGLARWWAKAGYPLIIGSRDPEKAQEVAATLPTAFDGRTARGSSYAEAAAAEIVVVTVPFPHQADVLAAIRPALSGQLLIDTTVPLVPPRLDVVQLPETGSAAVAAQRRLGSAARVVSAFHNVPAKRLHREERIGCDVLVFGDENADRETGITLVEAAGMRGLDGGPLANSIAAETLTPVLIGIQKRYQTGAACLRITGLRDS